MIKRIATIYIFTIIFAMQAIAQVSVEAKIDSFAIYIGRQANMKVEVTAPQGHSVVFPDFQPSQYIVNGVEVLSMSDADTVVLDNDKIKVTRNYTLTSFDEKLYSIPGMKVKVNNKVYTGNTVALKVITVDVDTLHPNNFFPPKGVQDNPFSWIEDGWDIAFYLSLLILVLFIALCYFYVRLKQNKPIITRIKIIKKVLPHQKALKAIDNIKSEKMVTSENQKEYYTRLTDTLRLYINERFGFSAMEMTSGEIIAHLQEKGNKEMIDELKDIFNTADLVKFAKYSTLINENDLNLVNAINFIDKTKIENQPTVERVVPQLTEEDKKVKQTRRLIKTLIVGLSIAIVTLVAYVIYHLYVILS